MHKRILDKGCLKTEVFLWFFVELLFLVHFPSGELWGGLLIRLIGARLGFVFQLARYLVQQLGQNLRLFLLWREQIRGSRLWLGNLGACWHVQN
ncbi:MAG: hypothetical protein KatS3mg087_0994 [Patescibacteria group bacterium]|nr:MAG: hypothetical protein KatS3mg087_0994 [Patescibacteria group bacterium]